MDRQDMKRVLDFLASDPVISTLLEDNVDNVSHALFSKPCATLILILFLQVVDAVYDCKSEVIGPRSYRFKAEIGKPYYSYYFSMVAAVGVSRGF